MIRRSEFSNIHVTFPSRFLNSITAIALMSQKFSLWVKKWSVSEAKIEQSLFGMFREEKIRKMKIGIMKNKTMGLMILMKISICRLKQSLERRSLSQLRNNSFKYKTKVTNLWQSNPGSELSRSQLITTPKLLKKSLMVLILNCSMYSGTGLKIVVRIYSIGTRIR